MGKLSEFKILFNGNKVVYFPGDRVTGQLVVQLKSPMDMKAIKLKFVGKAYVHWTETRTVSTGKSTTTYTDHFYGKEEYFEESIVVHGEGSSDARGSLPQGQHIFPFDFLLPSPLPSSYEDNIGHIRYYVKGTIVKPWKFDHNTKAAFTVLDNLDLNTIQNAMVPAGDSGSKYLCCWCCKSGPIEVDFHAGRTGYVPGEWIIVNATLTNGSSSKVKSTSIHLAKKMTYHSTRKKKKVTKILATVTGHECKGHSTITLKDKRIQIPPLPPSESKHCGIIDIDYVIMFEGHMRTCAVNLRESADIIIGTTPLRSLKLYQNAPGIEPTAPVGPVPPPSVPYQAAPQAASSQPTQYSTMPPPPSYAAATDGGVDIKDEDDNDYTMGNTTFTPQYTFYDWNQSAFTYN